MPLVRFGNVWFNTDRAYMLQCAYRDNWNEPSEVHVWLDTAKPLDDALSNAALKLEDMQAEQASTWVRSLPRGGEWLVFGPWAIRTAAVLHIVKSQDRSRPGRTRVADIALIVGKERWPARLRVEGPAVLELEALVPEASGQAGTT